MSGPLRVRQRLFGCLLDKRTRGPLSSPEGGFSPACMWRLRLRFPMTITLSHGRSARVPVARNARPFWTASPQVLKRSPCSFLTSTSHGDEPRSQPELAQTACGRTGGFGLSRSGAFFETSYSLNVDRQLQLLGRRPLSIGRDEAVGSRVGCGSDHESVRQPE